MVMTGLRHLPMRIGGEDVDTDDVFEIINPATEEIVATTARGTVGHADAAVAAARASFDSGVWADLPPQERSRVMLGIGEAMSDRADEFVELETMANGATVRVATGYHVGYATLHWNYFAELAGTYQFETAAPTPTFPSLGQSY